MNLLDPVQAKYFVSGLGTPVASSVQSLSILHLKVPPGGHLVEGSPAFDAHRASALFSAERWLLYGLVQYRRAFDMLVPGAAPWTQVTLYYSSFFAANALLAMFGGWVGQARSPNKRQRVVEVLRGTPGGQVLLVQRQPASPTQRTGSHVYFWDYFYDAAQGSLRPWAPPKLVGALDPVNQRVDWQIGERNRVNYDTLEAWSETMRFQQTFNAAPAKLRGSLAGPLAQQLDATENMLRLTVHFADDLGLGAGALHGCGQLGSRSVIQKRLVTQNAPRGSLQSIVAELLG